ncbi:hypothetical protein ACFSHR_04810 [Azotobacter chroococcum]
MAEMAPPDENQIRALREQFELAPEHFVIGTVGRLLDRHKRVSDLIRRWPRCFRPAPRRAC